MVSNDDIAKKMMEIFGENLADLDVFPKVFQYQAKLAKYQLEVELRNKENDNVQG